MTIIHTSYNYPPVPTRQFDWSAVTDNYDGAEDSHDPIGHGATEQEAVTDLLQQIADDAAAPPAPDNPLAQAKAIAIATLTDLHVPRLSPFATPDELGALRDFLGGLVEAVDPLIAAVGSEFVACAPGGHGIRSELAHFQNQLLNALDGAAMHALERAEEISAEEYEGAI